MISTCVSDKAMQQGSTATLCANYCTARAAFGHLALPRYAGLSADPPHWCSSARVNGLPQAVRARPMSQADPEPLPHRAAQQHCYHTLLHAQLPGSSGPNTACATGFQRQDPVHRPFHPCHQFWKIPSATNIGKGIFTEFTVKITTTAHKHSSFSDCPHGSGKKVYS